MNAFVSESIMIAGLLALPISALIGAITIGILKTLHRQKMVELAMKERIAAIERGVAPSDLPPLALNGHHTEKKQADRSKTLLVTALILIGFGIGLIAMLLLANGGGNAWPIGLLFIAPGLSLLIAAKVVKPSADDLRREVAGSPPHSG